MLGSIIKCGWSEGMGMMDGKLDMYIAPCQNRCHKNIELVQFDTNHQNLMPSLSEIHLYLSPLL